MAVGKWDILIKIPSVSQSDWYARSISLQKTMTLILMMSLLMIPIVMMVPRWGIMSAFPKPLLVSFSSIVSPRLFTTSKMAEMPYLPLDNDVVPIEENGN